MTQDPTNSTKKTVQTNAERSSLDFDKSARPNEEQINQPGNQSVLQSKQSNTINPELNSSKNCDNCGAGMSGKFCQTCGQSSQSVIKFFGDVVKELLDDALGWDSRLKHTLMPLIFRPGKLSLDYVKGMRFYYVLPFKLYLITSVLFIILMKNAVVTELLQLEQASDEIQQSNQEIRKATGVKAQKNIDVEPGTNKEPEEKPEPDNHQDVTKPDTPTDKSKPKNRITISSDEGEDVNWDKEKKQLNGLETLDDSWYKTFLLVVNPKFKAWTENPDTLVKSVIEILPMMMFVILPIFAIFLKIFYAFSNRYYTEHLVFLLHNHSFIYTIMMIQILLDNFEEKLLPIQHWSAQSTASILSFISVIFGFWMLAYVFLSVKRFYKQGWPATIFKVFSLGSIYMVLLLTGFVITIAVGAYQA